MSRAAPLLAFLLLLAAPAPAQEPVSDVPPGPGTIRGRLISRARPDAVGGTEVLLYALPGDAAPGMRIVATDAEGRFEFANVSNDPTTVYLVGARTGEIPFGERVRFAAGETEREVELRISESTTDVAGIVAGAVSIRADRGCSQLHVKETHELRNPTARVVYVPRDQRGNRPPVLRVELPAAASGFQAAAGGFPQALEFDDGVVSFWGPLYPGTQEILFGFSLPSDPGALELRWGLPAGADSFAVLTHARGAEARGALLEAGPDSVVDGHPYRSAASGLLPASSVVELVLEIPEAEASQGIIVDEAQLWIELDDAALTVNEHYRLQVEGDEPRVSLSDTPLLCLELPPGATDVQFYRASVDMGLAYGAEGGIAVRGPVPAGESAFSLRYQLPVTGDPLVFERRIPFELPLLSIFVADTGVVAETDRLHRLRPVKQNQRSYIHLEGFGIAPDETVTVRFDRLPAARGLPRLATAGFFGVVAAAVIGFLAAPLRGRAAKPDAASTPGSSAAEERETVYAAIRDLEDDFETGKLTSDDYEATRGELRARAGALLQAERAAEDATGAPAPSPVCPGCATPRDPGARFCAQCGVRLSDAFPAEEAAG